MCVLNLVPVNDVIYSFIDGKRTALEVTQCPTPNKSDEDAGY